MTGLLWRALAFLAALALGGIVAASLLAADVREAWALVAAWLVFFVVGTALVRLLQRREPH